MLREELLAEINRLSLDERLELLEILSRDIRESLHTYHIGNTPVERVRGILATDAPLPDDKELKRDYVDYLDAKYS